MGRQSKSLILALGWWVALTCCGHVVAQPHGGRPLRNGPVNNTRQRWFSLSPEERQVFRRNAERWIHMAPAERDFMRQREQIRRARLKQEADAALRDAGLRLDQQKREVFEQRYLEERRKFERELSEEVETRRRQQLPALNERLKREFQPTNPSKELSPAPSVSPNR